jgi:hypothetical protein
MTEMPHIPWRSCVERARSRGIRSPDTAPLWVVDGGMVAAAAPHR